ncbi:hypothetical protein [Capnocytophaga sp.]|uniref:hypothetical protein n=1 Tax=Capnocytophaga sp. TaxID=44737 RepID=UPI0026DB5E35|nr:hypothetical protein [Capnocytophaga sp.]MDO5105228.1 hypothetical protein [Capnocytophaga sp.]
MLKKIDLSDNHVYMIKISEEIFSVVQHRENTFFEFFDIFFTRPDAQKSLYLDLNSIPVLCTYSLADNKLKDFFVRKETHIKPNERECNRIFFHPFHYMMEGLKQGKQLADGVALVRRKSLQNVDYEVLIEYLNDKEHLNEIYQYNSFGMVGNTQKLQSELLKYVETGEFWSVLKADLFPKVAPYQKEKPIVHKAKEFEE